MFWKHTEVIKISVRTRFITLSDLTRKLVYWCCSPHILCVNCMETHIFFAVMIIYIKQCCALHYLDKEFYSLFKIFIVSDWPTVKLSYRSIGSQMWIFYIHISKILLRGRESHWQHSWAHCYYWMSKLKSGNTNNAKKSTDCSNIFRQKLKNRRK